jgi:hypothetical protein
LYVFDRELTNPGITFVKSDLSISKSLVADLDNDNLTINFASTTINNLSADTIYAATFNPSFMNVTNNLQVNGDITNFGYTGLGGYADNNYRLSIYPQSAVGALRIASTTAEILYIGADGVFNWNPTNKANLNFQVQSRSFDYMLKVSAENNAVGVNTSTPGTWFGEKFNVNGDSLFYGNSTTTFSFVVSSLSGAGNAYACLNSIGQLYRSATPCL